MKMFDMTRQDIEDLINHNNNLKKLCCDYTIQCSDYKGPLYGSTNTASIYLGHYLDILQRQCYNKYKDADETDAAIIFISIVTRIYAFYLHCWKLYEKIKSNSDFLFDNNNYKLSQFELRHLTNSCNISFQVINKKLGFKELDLFMGLGSKSIENDIKIYSYNIKEQIEYTLDNLEITLYILTDQKLQLDNVLLKTVKKTILDNVL